MRRLLIVFALVAAGCGSSAGTSPTSGSPGSQGTTPTTRIDTLRPCQESIPADAGPTDSPIVERVSAANLESASASISQAAFLCAADVVVVAPDDLERVAIAARLATGLGGPLLLGDIGGSSLLAYEIDRLAPRRVWFVGDDVTAPVPDFSDAIVLQGDDTALAARVNDEIDAGSAVTLPSGGGFDALRATTAALEAGAGIQPSSPAGSPPTPIDPVPHLRAGPGESGMAWLVDGGSPSLAVVAAATAVTVEGVMILVDGTDLRLAADARSELDRLPVPPQVVQALGAGPDAGWQLPVLLEGEELPGGGFVMFPGKRLVALYGNPNTTSLGVLGEQGPDASVTRARQLASQYASPGVQAIPAFEIIATVASGGPGDDGDYSNEMSVEQLRSWVDVAGREGVYVLLDLQPGRTDFLTQAKLYEELLEEPHVGLALDPEWRLLPGEVHLQQIGHVEAAEVNAVVDWLAALVREHHLPQKVLLLHQFQDQMLRDRETIETPTELAVVIQMDGQGEIANKYATWNRITGGWEGYGWRYGWKNFFDEDVPGPIPASEVLELVPEVVYVSYQ
ncbi:MAG TPA: hypothetical protein VK960_07695 [Acidimicrobiia bacterium]|nr:hypothetical protein [Acidimicrobiia bacterium]